MLCKLASKKSVYILLAILCIAVLVFCLQLKSIAITIPESIKRTNSIISTGLHEVPEHIRKTYLANKWPNHMCLIIIKQGNVKCFLSNNEDFWRDKANKVHATIIRLMHSTKSIPNGYYFLSLEDGVHQSYALPLLAFASDQELVRLKKVFLIPDFEAQNGYANLFASIDSARAKYPWHSKQPQILWRGSATGSDFDRSNYNFPRLKFMQNIAPKYKFVDAGFTNYGTKGKQKVYDYVAKKFKLANYIQPQESLAYKYLLDIDGHSCSYSRMAWIMYSNSLLLKHKSNKIQWYYDRLQPYAHYVPIRSDFSDLKAQYDWVETHPTEVQQIISNAQRLAMEVFSQEKIDVATRQSFLKYSQLMQED